MTTLKILSSPRKRHFGAYVPKLFSSYIPREKQDDLLIKEILSPICPECKNVDNRFLFRDYNKFASIIIICKYESDDYDLKCLCCRKQFKYLSNCIYVPLEYCESILDIDIITIESEIL